MRVLKLNRYVGISCQTVGAIAFASIVAGVGVAAPPTPQVSATLPSDVVASPGTAFQRFDDFSWRSFIALNWPALTGASHRGQADTARAFGDAAGARVWTTWKSRFEIFQGEDGPAGWTSYDGENPCGDGFTNDTTTLSSFSAFGDFNQAGLTSAGNPLVAQNRTYVRYDVRVNEPEFDTIVRNKWFIASNLPTAANPVPFDVGSVEVKAAWRILTSADTPEQRARYYTISGANVYDVAKEACTPQDIALVGFHIVSKTPSRPQWIWSTFEHVDNVPPVSSEPALPAGATYSFNDPAGPQALSPSAPPLPLTKTNPPDADPDPMQVVREVGILDTTMMTNQAYWALPGIKGTVWQNYMLVMTQWPKVPIPTAPEKTGDPVPGSLDGSNIANTTMETYFQSGATAKSCMECHQRSNALGMDFVMFVALDAFQPGMPSPSEDFRGRNESVLFGGSDVRKKLVDELNQLFDAARK